MGIAPARFTLSDALGGRIEFASLMAWAALASLASWYGLGAYFEQIARYRLTDAGNAVAQMVEANLGRLQTRVLVENGRLIDRQVNLDQVARVLGQESSFVASVETRDRNGRLQVGIDLTAGGVSREELNPAQLISLYSAASLGNVVLSGLYVLPGPQGSQRAFIDMFSPIGRGDADFLVIRSSVEKLLELSVAQAFGAVKLPARFELISAARTEPAEAGWVRIALKLDPFGTPVASQASQTLSLFVQAKQTAPDTPEIGLLRSVLSLLAAAIAILVPLQLKAAADRRRAQRQLKLLEQRLERESRFATLGETSAAIAHELNQPLAAIENFSFTCERIVQKRFPDADDLKQGLGEIRAQARRSADVIRSIRQVIKRRPTPIAEVNLHDVLRDLQPMLGIQARAHKCKLEINCEAALKLKCNRSTLEQVVLNLSRNGFEAMSSEVNSESDSNLLRITVGQRHDSANPRRKIISIIVSDSGPGIPPDIAANLFKPFSSTKQDGLGIGLSLCLSMIERQGGALKWRNNDRRGASFIVELPVDEPDPKSVTTHELESPSPLTSSGIQR